MRKLDRLGRAALGLLVAGAVGVVGCSSGPTTGETPLTSTAEALGAQSASFQDGVSPSSSYAGTRDTMLEQNSPTTNNGTDTSISISGDTPSGSGKDDVVLLSWDLSATIPSNAIVRSATITVNVSDKADQTYNLYQVVRAWDESKATWNLAATGTSWGTAGAAAASDRGSAVLGSITAASTGSYTITLNASGIAAVQQWVNNPSSNFGLIIAGTDNDNRLEIRSSEYSTKSSRPKLTVTWDLAASDAGAPDTSTDAGTGTDTGVDSGSDAGFSLVQTPGTYKNICSGSGAVYIDGTHFLNFDDEAQVVGIYTQGASGAPVQKKDISSFIGLSSSDEADIEDAARVGNRVYVTTSHARDKNGNLETSRYKFFGLDLSGTVPNVTITSAGYYNNLLQDMLVSANWVTPNATVISALNNASQLSKSTVASLAPKVSGTNIEGLAALGNTGTLVIGVRNPKSNSDAIVITLLNPDAVLGGATAQFGQAILMDLGGQGIRGMAWSDAHQSVFLISGPTDDSDSPFALWQWNGDAATAPTKVQDLASSEGVHPEAIIPYPGTKRSSDRQRYGIFPDRRERLQGCLVLESVLQGRRHPRELSKLGGRGCPRTPLPLPIALASSCAGAGEAHDPK